jgi:hypothetical protein
MTHISLINASVKQYYNNISYNLNQCIWLLPTHNYYIVFIILYQIRYLHIYIKLMRLNFAHSIYLSLRVKFLTIKLLKKKRIVCIAK